MSCPAVPLRCKACKLVVNWWLTTVKLGISGVSILLTFSFESRLGSGGRLFRGLNFYSFRSFAAVFGGLVIDRLVINGFNFFGQSGLRSHRSRWSSSLSFILIKTPKLPIAFTLFILAAKTNEFLFGDFKDKSVRLLGISVFSQENTQFSGINSMTAAVTLGRRSH